MRPMNQMNIDKSLIKVVHQETIGAYFIAATLTRFGGLCVIATNADHSNAWQGDNILEARTWVADQGALIIDLEAYRVTDDPVENLRNHVREQFGLNRDN